MTLAERANANLIAAYLGLGCGLPGAEVRETSGYTALLSDLAHPSGNFALRLDLDPWSVAELRDLAASRAAFQAVALPGDRPAHLAELFRRAGFEPVLRLTSMVAEPYSKPSDFEVKRMEAPDDRLLSARFVAEAFFVREPFAVREAIAQALVQTPDTEIVVHFRRDRPVAAVSLTRHAGIVGLYNLCVTPEFRGKGIGRSLVAWCLAQAAAEYQAVCLQTATHLEPWYALQGFVPTGAITGWSPSDRRI